MTDAHPSTEAIRSAPARLRRVLASPVAGADEYARARLAQKLHDAAGHLESEEPPE
jgi:hypothetical protein